MEETVRFNVSGLKLKKGIKKNLNIDKCTGNFTVLIRNTEWMSMEIEVKLPASNSAKKEVNHQSQGAVALYYLRCSKEA
jgi:hypothetical protein